MAPQPMGNFEWIKLYIEENVFWFVLRPNFFMFKKNFYIFKWLDMELYCLNLLSVTKLNLKFKVSFIYTSWIKNFIYSTCYGYSLSMNALQLFGKCAAFLSILITLLEICVPPWLGRVLNMVILTFQLICNWVILRNVSPIYNEAGWLFLGQFWPLLYRVVLKIGPNHLREI